VVTGGAFFYSEILEKGYFALGLSAGGGWVG